MLRKGETPMMGRALERAYSSLSASLFINPCTPSPDTFAPIYLDHGRPSSPPSDGSHWPSSYWCHPLRLWSIQRALLLWKGKKCQRCFWNNQNDKSEENGLSKCQREIFRERDIGRGRRGPTRCEDVCCSLRGCFPFSHGYGRNEAGFGVNHFS